MVTTFYPPYSFGGDATALRSLALALKRAGHEVTVVSDTDAFRALSQAPAAPAPAQGGEVRVEWLHSRAGKLSLLLTHQLGYPVMQGRHLRSFLAKGGFDVVHFHNISLVGGPGILGLPAGSAVKLYTAAEHWLVCPTHVLWRHQREPCTGRQCLRCTFNYRRPPQAWRHLPYFRRQLAHIDAFIAMSEFSRDKHMEFGFPHPMEVIPGFLPELPHFGQDSAAAPHPRPYFLFVGRLERLKGLDDVIPACGRYEDADLLVVGDGPHRAALELMASDYPNITFVGRVAHEELPRYYAHAIATVVPSIGFETFGFVVIESFRSGTPAVVRTVGPLPELVSTCGGGETFQTAEELVAALRRLQHDSDHRAELARRASDGFASHWAEHQVLPTYLGLVERLTRAKRTVVDN